jgi:hypothetical protein
MLQSTLSIISVSEGILLQLEEKKNVSTKTILTLIKKLDIDQTPKKGIAKSLR